MKKTLMAVCLMSLALWGGQAMAANAANAACEAKAIDKNGKVLAGAAKTSFMKKCEGEAAAGAKK